MDPGAGSIDRAWIITSVNELLVGRDSELEAVDTFLSRAASGSGGVLVITGEPGAGKSAFLGAVEQRWPAARTMRARGVAAEAVLPFAGLQQLAYGSRELVDRLPEPQAAAMRAAIGLGGAAEVDRYLVALAALGLFSEAGVDQPVLVLVDDFPWLDAASRAAIFFAARRLGTEPVAMLIASRSEDWLGICDPADDRRPAGPWGLTSNRIGRRVPSWTSGTPQAAPRLRSFPAAARR